MCSADTCPPRLLFLASTRATDRLALRTALASLLLTLLSLTLSLTSRDHAAPPADCLRSQ